LDKTSENEALCVNLGYPAIIIPIPSFEVEVYRSINPLAQMVKKGAERRCDCIMSEYIYNLVGGLEHKLYFSEGLKPPTSNSHTTMAFRHVIISYYII
jgi:hypothetical protein